MDIYYEKYKICNDIDIDLKYVRYGLNSIKTINKQIRKNAQNKTEKNIIEQVMRQAYDYDIQETVVCLLK